MATRSNIVIKRKNGKVNSIYCHWDGYLSHNGKILLENYQDIDKINKLIELGDISSLAENVEPTTDKHSFDNPEKNVVIAYKRDRGEENVEPRSYNNLEDYLNNVDKLFIEYIYLYDEEKSKWFYTDKTYHLSIKDFKELTKEDIEKE